MLRIETGLILLALAIAFFRPSIGSSWFEAVERRFSALARRRTLAVLIVGITALALRAAVLPIEPIPEPIVHDEFGYLLAADTFAHGRLTTPTPLMWEHFESFNILQKPSYQCITPPAQGLVLALGKVAFGHPFWGVWVSAGVMCAAITWMLQGWFSEGWALFGGVLAVLRYGVLTYWADSYWGGALGAIGGALVLGALPRIKASQRTRDALFLALGLAILLNNRPYDGFVFSLPVLIALLLWLMKKKRTVRLALIRRLVLPVVFTMSFVFVGTGFYFWCVTGSPLRMPYQVERQTYAVAPYLLWQPLHPMPNYHNAVMRKMYLEDEMASYQAARTPTGVLLKAIISWRFYLGPLLTLPFVLLFFSLPYGFSWKDVSPRTKFFLVVVAFMVLGCLFESFYVGAHYSSPVTGLVLALVVVGVQRIRTWTPGHKARGPFLSRAFVLVAGVVFVFRAFAAPLHIPLSEAIYATLYDQRRPGFGRAEIVSQLQQLPGKILVIVRYKPDHQPFEEWVYNDADIDTAKIVWARELGGEKDQELLDYFKGREVFLLEADDKPPKLELYGKTKN